MTRRPAYFEAIRARACARWEQLEDDPDLAGPWHQLFRQVQSPRHVLSELLQNADDAGATEAWARIEDGVFIFEHNGEDFTEEHFASLCRFGYSNKRLLHTIGFRGIGFKSTFSLGDCVELHTPTLSAVFGKGRFTEPDWMDRRQRTDGLTGVCVRIADENRRGELEKSLERWLKSPVSLLFFGHIRRITIGGNEVQWGSLGPGPVVGTEWMALDEDPDKAFLVARSDVEEFPEEALAEIRQERMLGLEEVASFPPCRVEIVLGAAGGLFVVLATGVETGLPFACNAPFIQDPARLKLKDPETSPTNRWLLRRAGKLAASVMSEWLLDAQLDPVERAQAYDLFPDVDRKDASLEGLCGMIVEGAFERTIEGQSILLTDCGELTPPEQSVIIPDILMGVWPPEQIAPLLDEKARPALSRHVSSANRRKLVRWNLIEEITKREILGILEAKHLPRPGTWRQLLALWEYIAPEITGYLHEMDAEDIRIVPVQGSNALYAGREVVRLGEKKLLQSEHDWAFLSDHLRVLNQSWPRYLAEHRRSAERQEDAGLHRAVEAAVAIFESIGLGHASDASKVIERVSAGFFSEAVERGKCVQLAQIAAKLRASAGKSFHFVTRDGELRSADAEILFDRDGSLESLLPDAWRVGHLLHSDYSREFHSCTREDWLRWIAAGRSGLRTFLPMVGTRPFSGSREDLEAELQRRGFRGEFDPQYSDPRFWIEDWDYPDELWAYWVSLSEEDPKIWGEIAERIMRENPNYWASRSSAVVVERASNGHTRKVIRHGLTPSWALRLGEHSCLRDTRGFMQRPSELLRRTPETEPHLDLEPFVHGELDAEATRPLLDLLGVGDTPTGPDRLFDRLRALARTDAPPVHEVEKWYRRLDRMLESFPTEDLQSIKEVFREERLILSEKQGWTNATGVFLAADEQNVPGAATIRAAVRDLALWHRIGVADYPTADLSIQWLKQLPSGEGLAPEDARRVRALLARHPARIWVECGHWLSVAGRWVPVESLRYALTMQSLIPWSHLHEWVKQKTADLQRLPVQVTTAAPFLDLPALVEHVEERLRRDPLLSEQPETKPWLNQLGKEFCRVQLDEEAETARIRTMAAVLANTIWQTTPGLEVTPYIDGTPAGTPRRAGVVWLDRALYVEERPLAKLAKAVAQELGRAFRRPEIADAIKLCFERPPEFVTEYVEENFDLAPLECLEPLTGPDPARPEDPLDMDPEGIRPEGRSPAPGVPNPEDAAFGDGDGLPEETHDVGDDRQGLRQRAKPTKPSIIERFALAQGFQEDRDGGFFHADGSCIAKAPDNRFPWARRSASGALARYYWPRDHCLERQPLELGADIWALIDEFPDRYALILSDPQDAPIEVPGERLRAMREQGELTLYPASYRLVCGRDRNA